MKENNQSTANDAPHVLLVDDELLLHNVLERLLSRHGIKLTKCTSAVRAVEHLEEQAFDLVLTDFKMPEMDGLELLAHIRQEYPYMKVIMITAHANVQHAVRAMRGGVIDYIPKPFSTSELINRLKRHLEAEAPAPSPAKKRAPRAKKTKQEAGARFIGESPAIEQLKELLPRVAQSQAPVFIHGESGTGKEILSRLVHETSARAEGPYVTMNCANLPRELVESHLFGHRKGAFTGAVSDMTGAFERADGGTLLLDEVTEIEPSIQAKLLRVLQEQEFQKVGTSETQKVDVRVIATSNRNLQEAVAEKLFREDLYHRLAVFPLHVPPLRNRLADVPLLAGHFVKKYCALYDLPEKRIAPELMQRFRSYNWPGNVRQLENMVHRGVVLAADREVVASSDVVNDFFSATDASAQADAKAAVANGKVSTIEEMERYMILNALAEEGINQKDAAERLGISARTIRNKLKQYREEGYWV